MRTVTGILEGVFDKSGILIGAYIWSEDEGCDLDLVFDSSDMRTIEHLIGDPVRIRGVISTAKDGERVMSINNLKQVRSSDQLKSLGLSQGPANEYDDEIETFEH